MQTHARIVMSFTAVIPKSFKYVYHHKTMLNSGTETTMRDIEDYIELCENRGRDFRDNYTV